MESQDQEDVEQFLWDLERELSHLGGQRRRELVKEAEDRLHEVATAIAESEQADQVRWFHYVQASAEIGPPERLAAELTGEPLPDRRKRHVQLWVGAGALVLAVVGLLAFAWFTTGTLEPLGEWSGEEEDGLTERREFSFDVGEEADSVFLTVSFTPTQGEANARITVLDGASDVVFQREATTNEHLQTSEFLEGEAGSWRIVVDFEDYVGAWRLEAQQEV